MRRWFFSVLLLLLSCGQAHAQPPEPWRTTRFEVFTGDPFVGTESLEEFGYDWLEFEDLLTPSDAVIREIERALQEAAEWYKKKGFPPPFIKPVIQTDQGLAYRVYVCSVQLDQSIATTFSNVLENTTGLQLRWGQCNNQAAGSYTSECGDDPTRTNTLVVNSDKALDANGKLTELGYQTIAHELMHAIIANTPFGKADRSCDVNGWITESLPDAISFDIAEELWASRYTAPMSSQDVIKRYGYRPYNQGLPKSDVVPIPGGGSLELKYATSSFWRYIADIHQDGWGVLVTQRNRPNAVTGLLDSTLVGPKGWKREVDWLDQGLRRQLNLGLDQVYGLFVNYFAYQVAPMKSFQGRPAAQNLDKWVEILYGTCASVDLNAASSQSFILNLRYLSSGCIWVEPFSGSGLVQITFQAASDKEKLLQDISIGRSGTALLSRAVPIGRTPDGSRYQATWKDWGIDSSRRNLFVVSNVSRVPSRSETHTVNFTVALPNHMNSALATVPLPPRKVARPPLEPSYNKHAKKLMQQKRDTQKMIEEQMNLDKGTLNPEVSNSVTLSRNTGKPPCTDPFVYQVCGPHATITLSLMPGTYIIPGTTNAQGGIAAQTFGGLMAMSQTSMWDTQQRMQHLDALIKNIDGSHVNIATPLFDYGQTPTFDNAYISVDMSGDRTWSAIGPPNQNGWSRLRGTVVIEEYTPFVLRGRFRAPLAEFVESGQPDQPPVYTPRQTVTGTFTSVAPWLSDERYTLLTDSTEQMADDIANTLGVPAGMINKMKQDGTMPGMPNYNPGAASGGALASDCTCECSMRPQADELCEMLCEEEFALCD